MTVWISNDPTGVKLRTRLDTIPAPCQICYKTVKRYLDLLEKTFVIVRLGVCSRNLRNDQGALWENFMLIERLKFRAYSSIHGSMYFWRTYGQQEIDRIEERDGALFAYECKWSEKRKVCVPAAWGQVYPGTSFEVITPENYQGFVMG